LTDTAKLVHAEGGLVEHYDKLVIATGSTPYIPALDNITNEEGTTFKEGIFCIPYTR